MDRRFLEAVGIALVASGFGILALIVIVASGV